MDIEQFISENMFSIDHANGQSESVVSTDDVRLFMRQQIAEQPNVDVLVEALQMMVDSYEYEASSENPSLLNAKNVLAIYQTKLLPKEE
ncbi:MAG: hypothetical protein V4440_14675 [Pseudomonadota bacterium]